MRKVMMGALVALLVALFAAAAFAATFTCTTNPCEGTNNPDTISERVGNGVNDNISGKRGGDSIDASVYTNDRDDLFGNRGPDTLNAQDGDGFDLLDGGQGTDECIGDATDTFVRCEVIRTPA